MAADGGALTRGIVVLEQVVSTGAGIGVTEIAQRCGMDKSSASRVLATLRELGYVHQRSADRRYVAGSRALWLAQGYRNALAALTVQAHAHLEAVRDATGETVHLAVRDGFWVIYLDQVDSGRSVTVQSAVGNRLELHRTAMGRAILAAMAAPERDRLLTEITAAAGQEAAESLRVDAARVADRGWAGVDRHDDVTRLAAAILDAGGAPIAALTISGPSYRVDPRLAELGAEAARAAESISAALGASG